MNIIITLAGWANAKAVEPDFQSNVTKKECLFNGKCFRFSSFRRLSSMFSIKNVSSLVLAAGISCSQNEAFIA
jgi:hypothetical protein